MPIYMKLEGIKGTVQPAAGDHVPTEQFALNFTKVQVESARTGGVNFQMGDGSVRIARDDDDSFDFKPGDGSVKPGDGSVRLGDGSVKLGDGSVMPQDEKGIIAILIGLMDRQAMAYEEGRYEDAVEGFGQADVGGVAGALSDGWSTVI